MVEKSLISQQWTWSQAFWSTAAFSPVPTPLCLCPCDVFQQCPSPVGLPSTKLFFTPKASQEIVTSENLPSLLSHPELTPLFHWAFSMPNAFGSNYLKLPNLSPVLD